MQIQLMTYIGENNRLNKNENISNIFAVSGCLKEETSIIDPIILIEKDTNPVNTDYNYLFIPEFKRYYFIKDIVSVHNKMWMVYAHEDVLFSHANDILRNKAIVKKSEDGNNANMYLNDGGFVMDSRKYNQVYQFPSGLSSTGNNILIVAGGAYNAG